jgi:hypothetical protein
LEAGAAGGGTSGASSGAEQFAQGFTDTGTAGGALDTGYAGSGAITGATGTASPSNIPSWLKDAMPLLSTGAGALLGSQPQTNTQTRDIPDWLKSSVIGDASNPGLLGYTRNLLAQQSTPEFQAPFKKMTARGNELLDTPMVGNGFSKFFGAGGQGMPSGAMPGSMPMLTQQQPPPGLMGVFNPRMQSRPYPTF